MKITTGQRIAMKVSGASEDEIQGDPKIPSDWFHYLAKRIDKALARRERNTEKRILRERGLKK